MKSKRFWVSSLFVAALTFGDHVSADVYTDTLDDMAQRIDQVWEMYNNSQDTQKNCPIFTIEELQNAYDAGPLNVFVYANQAHLMRAGGGEWLAYEIDQDMDVFFTPGDPVSIVPYRFDDNFNPRLTPEGVYNLFYRCDYLILRGTRWTDIALLLLTPPAA